MFTNKTLWILQVVMGVYFIGVGVLHFIVPEGLPGMMSWMYELDDNLHLISGSVEILAGIGLILPGLTKIMPKLTILAAEGLVLVMAGAVILHISRGEWSNVANNVVLGAILAVIAYGRARRTPLPS
jgi:uncharacterized membrane protein